MFLVEMGARTNDLVGELVRSIKSFASADVARRDGCAVDAGLETWLVRRPRLHRERLASKMLLGRFGARSRMLYDAGVERVRWANRSQPTLDRTIS